MARLYSYDGGGISDSGGGFTASLGGIRRESGWRRISWCVSCRMFRARRWGSFARAGLGEEPRKAFGGICEIAVGNVVMPTRKRVAIRKRCFAKPTPH